MDSDSGSDSSGDEQQLWESEGDDIELVEDEVDKALQCAGKAKIKVQISCSS